MFKHNRDIAILIALATVVYMIVLTTTPACFSTLFNDLQSSLLKFELLIFTFSAKIILPWLMNPCIPHHKTVTLQVYLRVKYPLRFFLCSPRYTAVRIKNCLKSTSIIKVATMKKEAIKFNHQINAFSLSANMNGTERRTQVSPSLVQPDCFFLLCGRRGKKGLVHLHKEFCVTFYCSQGDC